MPSLRLCVCQMCVWHAYLVLVKKIFVEAYSMILSGNVCVLDLLLFIGQCFKVFRIVLVIIGCG